MILPERLRNELEEKRNKLVYLIHEEREQGTSQERAIVKRYKQVKTMQQKEARVHAARGEVPVSELHYRPHAVDKDRFLKVLHGIETAWDFGLLAYPGKPNTDFLKKLAWEIDPSFFEGDTAFFRRPGTMTIVQGWNYVPPSPEQAFLFNFHISRIQPFPDCNKRTGKLTQNLHLNFYNYPPATVLEGESGYYYRHLIEAIRGYGQREGSGDYSEQEMDFFEFLGTRVNNNLDAILDRSKYVPHQLKSQKPKSQSSKKVRKAKDNPGRKISQMQRR